MRRVYMAHYLRIVLSATAFKLYAIGVLLWELGRQVWVARVFENSPGLNHPVSTFNFFSNAVLETELLVQGVLLVAVVLAVWFTRDIISRPRHTLSVI